MPGASHVNLPRGTGKRPPNRRKAPQRVVGAASPVTLVRSYRATSRASISRRALAGLGVGFEVVALGPLVPRLDHQDLLARRVRSRDLEGSTHVIAETLGCRIGGDQPPPPRPRRVVPVRIDAGEDRTGEIRGKLEELLGVGVSARPLDHTPRHQLVATPAGEGDGEGELVVDGCVEPVLVVGQVRGFAERGHQVEAFEARLLRHRVPLFDEPSRVGEIARLVDEQQRAAADGDVPVVFEGAEQVVEVGLVVFGSRVGLLHQDLVRRPVPDPRPRLVGPGDAEGELGTPAGKDLFEGPLEEQTSREPVVPVAEARYPVRPREVGLGLAYFGNSQIVETEVRGEMRLDMSAEEGTGLRDVGPLCEAGSPPLVVFGDRMELG